MKRLKVRVEDLREINNRWQGFIAPGNVFSKQRTPFKLVNNRVVEDDDGSNSSSGKRKAIDAYLVCAWSPVLFHDILVKESYNNTKKIIRFLRALFIMSTDDELRYMPRTYMKELLAELEPLLPPSIRQLMWHLTIHTLYEGLFWGSCRNTWCFPTESQYGKVHNTFS